MGIDPGRTQFLILSAFPAQASRWFLEYSSATVACWLGAGVAGGNKVEVARSRILDYGWVAARLVERKVVTAASYPPGTPGREHYLQAQVDGFVAHFHRSRRECFPAGGSPQGLRRLLDTFRRETSKSGAWTIAPARGKGGVCATIKTPEGETCVPLWLTEGEVVTWLATMSSEERVVPRLLRPPTLVRTLTRIEKEADKLAAIGLARSRLVTVHPLGLLPEAQTRAGADPSRRRRSRMILAT